MKEIKQARAVATCSRIVNAAARLFAVKGYHDTKLDEILKAARVTTGCFFHHFGSKEELGFAVLETHMHKRRQRLEQIEKRLGAGQGDDPLERVFQRLDAIQAMIRQRDQSQGGCVIGNLSTSLSDTHDAFRKRLAECFDEMALEFKPHLDAAAKRYCPRRRVDTWGLARYIVAILEGSIMLGRTRRDRGLMARHFDYLKDYLRQAFGIAAAQAI